MDTQYTMHIARHLIDHVRLVMLQVADCQNAMVNVLATNVLDFKGHGHGARGVRDYALRCAVKPLML